MGSETSGTSGTAAGLDCNTTYYFRVSARGDGSPYSTSFGSASASVSKKPECPDAPAPGGLKVTSSTSNSVSLSWNPVTNAHRYKLERRKGTTGSWSTVSSYISGTSRTVYSLTCDTTYYFRVSARGDGSPYSTTFGSVSTSVSKWLECPDAPAPGGLSVTSSTHNSVSLSWNSVTNAHRYKLERRKGTTGSWSTVSSYISGTSRTVYSLTCDTTYYFRVSARGDGSPYSTTFGSVSSSVSKWLECPDAPAPSGLSVTSSDDDSVTLSWNAVTNAHRYKLEQGTSSSGPWTAGRRTTSG